MSTSFLVSNQGYEVHFVPCKQAKGNMSTSFLVRYEMDLVPLACEDGMITCNCVCLNDPLCGKYPYQGRLTHFKNCCF